jgi:hypothetical protein
MLSVDDSVGDNDFNIRFQARIVAGDYVPVAYVRDLHVVQVIAVIVGRGSSAVIGARGLAGNGAVPPGGTFD